MQWDRVISEVQNSRPNHKQARCSLNGDVHHTEPAQRVVLVRPYDPPRPPPIRPFSTKNLWKRLIFDVENSTTSMTHVSRSQNLTYRERDAKQRMEPVHPFVAPQPPPPAVHSCHSDSSDIYAQIDYNQLRCNLHGYDQRCNGRSLPPLLAPRLITRPPPLPPRPPPPLPPRPPLLYPRPALLPPPPPHLTPHPYRVPHRSPFTFRRFSNHSVIPPYISPPEYEPDYLSTADSDEESIYESISNPESPANKDRRQSKDFIPTWLFPEHNRLRRNALVPLPDGLFYFKDSPPTGIVDKNCHTVNLSGDNDLQCSGTSTDTGDKNDKLSDSRRSSNGAIQRTFSLQI
ncbi:hypothetical protein J6590_035019 [Homalodisca vitripennis]|nr:hypothetical protein J6590_035019 [Homalodisca vitripennis]